MNLTRAKKAIATCNDLTQLKELITFIRRREGIVTRRIRDKAMAEMWGKICNLPHNSVVYVSNKSSTHWGKPLYVYARHRRNKARTRIHVCRTPDHREGAIYFNKEAAFNDGFTTTPPLEAVIEALS